MQGDGSVHLGIPAQDKTSRAGEQLGLQNCIFCTLSLYMWVYHAQAKVHLKDIMFQNLAVSLVASYQHAYSYKNASYTVGPDQ